MGSPLGLALAAIVWLLPPPVLPTPSRTGPEGPPRPYGAAPAPGRQPPATPPSLAAEQTRALRFGPFPRGGLVRGISDGGLLLGSSAAVRDRALALMHAAGATVVRIPANWNDLVAAQPAAGFDARDPGDPSYRFALLDAAVRSTAAAGLRPLLVVSHAPAFAEAPGRWPYAYPGSWAPGAQALGEFATALARRYDGAFPDPAGHGARLPAVRLFQAWNEPNLARSLEPQWVAAGRRWQAFSPGLYRGLLNAFYAGIKSAQPHALVIAAGLAPNGDPAGTGRIAPVTFLARLLCLSPARAHVRASCPDPPHFDVLAFHPLSYASPDVPAASALNVSIADAAKVARLLAAARRARTVLPAGPKPLWVTELNWESAPEAPHGVPDRLQAQWVSRALHRLWVAGVSLVDWEFLIDPAHGVLAFTPTGGTLEYQRFAGLYRAAPGGDPAAAAAKPFLRGFRLPFDPLRVSRSRVRVWALLAAPREPIALQARGPGGSWRTVARLRAGAAGVLNALVALRGRAALRVVAGSLVSGVAAVGR